MNRRSFIGRLAGAIAAPFALVRKGGDPPEKAEAPPAAKTEEAVNAIEVLGPTTCTVSCSASASTDGFGKIWMHMPCERGILRIRDEQGNIRDIDMAGSELRLKQ